MPPSYALLGGFAIGDQVALLRQHNANAKCSQVHVCTRSMASFVCDNIHVVLSPPCSYTLTPHPSDATVIKVSQSMLQSTKITNIH